MYSYICDFEDSYILDVGNKKTFSEHKKFNISTPLWPLLEGWPLEVQRVKDKGKATDSHKMSQKKILEKEEANVRCMFLTA